MPLGMSALASTELAVTNRRILGRMRKTRLALPFDQVESVILRRGLMGLICNYGSVTITGNGMRLRFPGISRPADMKAVIDRAVENALFGDRGGGAEPDMPPRPLPPKAPPAERPPHRAQPAPSAAPAAYKDPHRW